MLRRRNNVPMCERVRCDKEIEENLWQLPEMETANTVMFYLSMGSEVGTDNMVLRALKSKTVAVPVTVPKERRLIPVRLASLKDTCTGVYNIREPREKTPVPLDSIDLVVVPGIAFDGNCNRIGYGGGYYDRFLPLVKAPAIALAYSLQIVSHLPYGPSDVPVDAVVTELGIIRRKPVWS